MHGTVKSNVICTHSCVGKCIKWQHMWVSCWFVYTFLLALSGAEM